MKLIIKLRVLFVLVYIRVVAKLHAELQDLCMPSSIINGMKLYLQLGVQFKLLRHV